MTEIRVSGPAREWMFEYDDDGMRTGAGWWAQVLHFEAKGTDGQVHSIAVTTPDVEVDSPFIAVVKRQGSAALEGLMREQGVWACDRVSV